MYWISLLKVRWHILIPLLILDVSYISIYIYCVLKLHRQQKIANKLMDKQQKVLLNFEKDKLSVFFCGTGAKLDLNYEGIVSIELKNVFFNNLPVFIKKENLEDKPFIQETLKNISNRTISNVLRV